jgi:hypothetical protein
MVDPQNGLQLLTSDDIVILLEMIKAYKSTQTVEPAGDHTLPYDVRPMIKRGGTRKSIRLNEELYKRVTETLKARGTVHGSNFNQLVEYLLVISG